jgi:hypothetical protein
MTTSARRPFSEDTRRSPAAPAMRHLSALLLCAAAMGVAAFGGSQRVGTEFPVFVQTKPAVKGVSFAIGDHRIRSDRNGLALVPLARAGTYDLVMPTPQQLQPDLQVGFVAWSNGSTEPSGRVTVRSFTYLTVGLSVRRLTSFRFVDNDGRELQPEWIESLTLIDDTGKSHLLPGAGPHWLEATRVSPGGGLDREEVSYAVQSVVVDGVNVASDPRVTFRPGGDSPRVIEVRTLRTEPSPRAAPPDTNDEIAQPLTVIVRDALFGFPIGTAVRLRYPDGRSQRLALDEDARVSLGRVPPGNYVLSADGPGFSLASSPDPNSPVVRLSLLSYLDIAALLLVAVAVVVGVVVLRSTLRRHGRGRARLVVSEPTGPAQVRSEPPPPPAPEPVYGETTVRVIPGPEPEQEPAPRDEPPVTAEQVAAAGVTPAPDSEPGSPEKAPAPTTTGRPQPPPPPEPTAEGGQSEAAPEDPAVAEPGPGPVESVSARRDPGPEKTSVDEPELEPVPAAAGEKRVPEPPAPDDPRLVRPRGDASEERVVHLEPESVPAPGVPPSPRKPRTAPAPDRGVAPPPSSSPPGAPRHGAAPAREAAAAEARAIIEDAEKQAREQRRLIARQRDRLIDEMSRRRAQLEERERELTDEITNLETTLRSLRSQLNVKIATSWLERENGDEDPAAPTDSSSGNPPGAQSSNTTQ